MVMIPECNQKYTAFNSFLMEETGYKTRYFLEGLFEEAWQLLHPEADDRPVFYNSYAELAKDILDRGVLDNDRSLPIITTSPAKSEHARSMPEFIPIRDNGFCAHIQFYPLVKIPRRRFTGSISLDELTTEISRQFVQRCESR